MAENDIDRALTLAPFDRDELLTAIDGDVDLFSEIIVDIREEASALISTIDAAIACGNADGLERAAHALKGSALTISAEKVARLAHILEAMGKNHDLSGAKQVVVHVKAGQEELEKIFASGS